MADSDAETFAEPDPESLAEVMAGDGPLIHGPSPEALATIPAENERRARLYDALWKVAYHRHDVRLWTSGTHGTYFNVSVDAGRDGITNSDMETVERWLTEFAEGVESTVIQRGIKEP